MGAAITLLVILTLSVVVVRIAAIALRLTGMPVDVARFQARSAFTGTGFTTSETEAVVNHPIRRRVIGLLMILGNIGMATVLATFIVSLVGTENSFEAISRQLFWLLGAIGLLWIIALNPLADRVMCGSIRWLLHRTTSLGLSGPSELLQITDGYSVAEHIVTADIGSDEPTVSNLCSESDRLMILGIKHDDGSYSPAPELETRLVVGDKVVLYGSDNEHNSLHEKLSPVGRTST